MYAVEIFLFGDATGSLKKVTKISEVVLSTLLCMSSRELKPGCKVKPFWVF